MNGLLLDLFRHNAWATQVLLKTCSGLPANDLNTPADEAYGSIIATFNHIISADARYLHHITKSAPSWAKANESSADLDVLLARAEELEQLWEQVLAEPLDAERQLLVDNGTYKTSVGVVIAQAIHHGNAHREQICAQLTRLGIEPPDVQAWGYADATGRGMFIAAVG
jgi:uncharacterized damage-inducible protein DinB